MDQQAETTLPAGYQEVVLSNEPPVQITSRDIPWMGKEEKSDVQLAAVTLEDGRKFYIGNAVRGRLRDVVEEGFGKDKKRNEVANELFYKRLQAFFQGDGSRIGTVQRPSTTRQIYYVGNREGIRVYFMRLEDRKGIPVIIRIGACAHKNQEGKILKVISDERNPKAI